MPFRGAYFELEGVAQEILRPRVFVEPADKVADGVEELLLATGGLATGGLATGRLKRQSARPWKSVWGARAAVALVCYVVQTWACAHFLGRAAAGYYAVSLPLSAAYLARYWWLLSHRTRLVILAASLPAQSAKLARLQKQLLSAIDAEVQKLPARQREAFLMRYLHDLDVAETAEAMAKMGIDLKSVAWAAH